MPVVFIHLFFYSLALLFLHSFYVNVPYSSISQTMCHNQTSWSHKTYKRSDMPVL